MPLDIDLETMNKWLDTHKSHNIRFVRRRWPLEKGEDAEGFPLPAAAGVKERVIITALHCLDCHIGFKIAVDDDSGQDITK